MSDWTTARIARPRFDGCGAAGATFASARWLGTMIPFLARTVAGRSRHDALGPRATARLASLPGRWQHDRGGGDDAQALRRAALAHHARALDAGGSRSALRERAGRFRHRN